MIIQPKIWLILVNFLRTHLVHTVADLQPSMTSHYKHSQGSPRPPPPRLLTLSSNTRMLCPCASVSTYRESLSISTYGIRIQGKPTTTDTLWGQCLMRAAPQPDVPYYTILSVIGSAVLYVCSSSRLVSPL